MEIPGFRPGGVQTNFSGSSPKLAQTAVSSGQEVDLEQLAEKIFELLRSELDLENERSGLG